MSQHSATSFFSGGSGTSVSTSSNGTRRLEAYGRLICQRVAPLIHEILSVSTHSWRWQRLFFVCRTLGMVLLSMQLVSVAAVGYAWLGGSPHFLHMGLWLGTHTLLLSPVGTFHANVAVVIALFAEQCCFFFLVAIAYRATRSGSKMVSSLLHLLIAWHLESSVCLLLPIVRRCLLLLQCHSDRDRLVFFEDVKCSSSITSLSMFLAAVCIILLFATTAFHACALHASSCSVPRVFDLSAMYHGQPVAFVRLAPMLLLVTVALLPYGWMCGIVCTFGFFTLWRIVTPPTVFGSRSLSTMLSCCGSASFTLSVALVVLSAVEEQSRDAVAIPVVISFSLVGGLTGAAVSMFKYRSLLNKMAYLSRLASHIVPPACSVVAPVTDHGKQVGDRSAVDCNTPDVESPRGSSSSGGLSSAECDEDESDFWSLVMANASSVTVVVRFLMKQDSLGLAERVQRAMCVLEAALTGMHKYDAEMWLQYLSLRMYLAECVDVLERFGTTANCLNFTDTPAPSASYIRHCKDMASVFQNSILDARLSQRVLRELGSGQLAARRNTETHRSLDWLQRIQVSVLSVTALKLASILTMNAGDSMMVHPLLSGPQSHYDRCVRKLRVFWRTLLGDAPSVTSLPPLVASIHQHAQAAKNEYVNLVERFPKDVRILRSYARFLSDVDAHPLLAAELLERASVIDDEEATKRRGGDVKIHDTGRSTPLDSSRMCPPGVQPPPSGRPRRERDIDSISQDSSRHTSSVSFSSNVRNKRVSTIVKDESEIHSASAKATIGNTTSTILSPSSVRPVTSGCKSTDDPFSPLTAGDHTDAQSMHSLPCHQSSSVGGNGNGAPQHALKVSLWRERVESSRSRSLVRLRTAVALAIVLLVAGFVGAFVLSRVLLSSYANTGSIINRAGKNRKLSQSCGLFARALQLDLSYPGASAAYSAAAAVEHSASLIKTAEALYSNLNFLISAPVQDVKARDKVWNDVHYEAVSYIPSTSATSVMSYALKDLGYKTASLSRSIASLTASSGGNSSHFATNEAFRFVVDNSFSRLLDNFQNAVRQFVEMFQSTNDSFQTALVSQLALSLAIPILLCALVFLPAYRTFVRERNELYHLLRTVPKPMVRKAYLHAGGKDADASSAKQQDASDEEAGLSDLERMHKACETTDDMADASDMNVKVQGDPLQKTTRRFLLSCILCATAMCALAAEGFFYVKLFETLTIEVNYSGFRRASTHRSRALAQEMLVEDLRAFSGGMSELRTLLLAEIARFMKFDRGLRVGDASLNLPGSDGESSLLDDLYYSPQCSDMSLFKCLSASQMIDRYSQRLTDWASMPTTSLTATSSVYSEILAMEDVLSPLMESAVNLYATRFDGVVQAMSTVADAVFGCTFPILVLCFASVFLAIDELESQTRRARIMYLLLPASFIESAPLVQHLALNITQSNSAVAGQAGKPGGNRDLSQASRSQLIEHAEYVENRYRRLMETSKDGIVELAIHDGDPRVDTCNAAFLSMMGARDSVAVAGRLFFSLLAKEKDVTVVRNAVTTLLGIGDETDSNAKLSVCCNMIRVDSSVLPVRLDLAKSAQTIVMFVRDLTDIQRKEELITYEKQRSEDLLRNVMPDKIARRLQNGETLIADYNEECTIFFSDIKSFTEISNRLSPRQLVVMLNTLLTGMDRLARHYGCERVKSIGDAAFVVCGVPEACTDHALRMVEYSIAVLDMLEMMNSRGMLLPGGECIQLRIGLHSGPVVSGVIGESKFAFDLWSDSVNVASRMESTGIPNKIQITRTTYELLWNQYDFEDRGEVDVKGKGSVHTYLYRGRIQPPKLPEPKWDEVLDIKTACISLNRAAEPHRNKED